MPHYIGVFAAEAAVSDELPKEGEYGITHTAGNRTDGDILGNCHEQNKYYQRAEEHHRVDDSHTGSGNQNSLTALELVEYRKNVTEYGKERRQSTSGDGIEIVGWCGYRKHKLSQIYHSKAFEQIHQQS